MGCPRTRSVAQEYGSYLLSNRSTCMRDQRKGISAKIAAAVVPAVLLLCSGASIQAEESTAATETAASASVEIKSPAEPGDFEMWRAGMKQRFAAWAPTRGCYTAARPISTVCSSIRTSSRVRRRRARTRPCRAARPAMPGSSSSTPRNTRTVRSTTSISSTGCSRSPVRARSPTSRNARRAGRCTAASATPTVAR